MPSEKPQLTVMTGETDTVCPTDKPSAGGAVGRIVAANILQIVLSFVVMASIISATLQITHTVPRDESAGAALLYDMHPVFVYGGTALVATLVAILLYSAWRSLRAGSRAWAVLEVLGAVGVVTSAWFLPWAAISHWAGTDIPRSNSRGAEISIEALRITGAIFVVLFVRALRGAVACGGRLRGDAAALVGVFERTRFLDLLKHLPAIVLLSCAASAIVGACETTLYVRRIIAEYGLDVTAWRYYQVTLSSSVLFGSKIGLWIWLGLTMTWGVCRALPARARPLVVPILLGAIAAWGLYSFLNGQLDVAFHWELVELELLQIVTTFVAVVSAMVAMVLTRSLLDLAGGRTQERSFGVFLTLYIMSLFLLPLSVVSWLVRRPMRKTLATRIVAVLIGAGVIVLMSLASYPDLYDVTSKSVHLWAMALTACSVLMGLMVLAASPRFWLAKSAVLLVIGLLAGWSLGHTRHDSETRVLLYGYSAIAKAHIIAIDQRWPVDDPIPADQPAIAPAPAHYDPPRDFEPFKSFGQKRPLTIIVLFDACRPDKMNVYGYRRTTGPLDSNTPQLDKRRDDLLIFKNAYVQGTATSCSLRHLFTGCYSSRWMLKQEGNAPYFTNELIRAGYRDFILNIHGTDRNGVSTYSFVRDMPPSLARRVRYSSQGVIDETDQFATAMATRFGRDYPEGVTRDVHLSANDAVVPHKQIALVTEQFDKIQARGNKDLSGTFVFVHMRLTHFPWRHYVNGTRYGEHDKDLYDEAVSAMDHACGELFRDLEKRGVLDKSVMIFTADHGTGLNEHGRYGGFHPYKEQVHVPLIMRIPGVEGREIEQLVALFDLAPTLVSPFCTPEQMARFDAVSLWPLIAERDHPTDRVVFGLDSFAYAYYLAMQDGTHYIWCPEWQFEQLYNTRTDPGERRMLNRVEPDLLNQCRSRMRGFMNTSRFGHTDQYNYRPPDPE